MCAREINRLRTLYSTCSSAGQLLWQSSKSKIDFRRHIGGTAVLLATWGFFAWGAATWLVVHRDLKDADALVVLAGSSVYSERAIHAAHLFRQGRAPIILLTNDGEMAPWSNEQQRNPFFVELTAEILMDAGVPPKKIEILTQVVSSTHDEAELLREYTGARHLRSLLIVTSPYHSRRALWTLSRVLDGNDIQIGMSVAIPGSETPSSTTWWLYSSGWRTVAGEYLKLAYYSLSYSRKSFLGASMKRPIGRALLLLMCKMEKYKEYKRIYLLK